MLGQQSRDDLSLGSPWRVQASVGDGTLAGGAAEGLRAAALAVSRAERTAVASGSASRSVATTASAVLHAATAYAERLCMRKWQQLAATSLRVFRRRAPLMHPSQDPGEAAAADAVEQLKGS